MSASTGSDRTPAWVWFLGGCLTVIVVIALGIGLVTFFGYRWARNIAETQKSPASRNAKACEILGCDGLPEGYHAAFAVQVPFLADLAVLSDRAPGPDGDIQDVGDNGMIYIRSLRMGSNEQELRDFFEGRTDDVAVLKKNNINLDAREMIARGKLPGDDRKTMMYVVQRGTVDWQKKKAGGLLTTVVIECAGDKKMRLALWFGPDPLPGQPLTTEQLGGTVGDPARIGTFMNQFRFCPAS